jgi:hypothetical protein
MQVSKQEIDIVFDVFDQSKNGEIAPTEFQGVYDGSLMDSQQQGGVMRPEAVSGPVGDLIGRIPAEGKAKE